jgi:hypothetical protein
MSNWNQWKTKKNIKENLATANTEPADRFIFNRNHDNNSKTDDELKKELLTLVFSKYPQETLQFIDGIAQRGDESVLRLLRKLNPDGPVYIHQNKFSHHPVEVIQPSSDKSHGNYENED